MRWTLLALVLFGCTSRTPPPGAAGPAEAVQALAVALRKGDTETAWSLLSTRTRAAADETAAKARAAADAGPASGREMLFSSALPQGPIEPRVVRQDASSAEVRAGDATFRVVREGDVWRVDLPIGR